MKQFNWTYRSGARLLTTLLVFLLPLSMADLGGAASSSPTWGNASLIPGASALNVGQYADLALNSISCTSQGNCAAGGTYRDASGVIEGFVADQVNGVWNNAEEIPGLGAIGDGGISVNSLSCASPGNCSAGGAYESSGVYYGFLVNEVSGVWETVETVGISSLGDTAVTAVSCPSAGNCTAGGSYVAGLSPANFVIDESNGTWGTPIEVPNLTALNSGPVGSLVLSCASTGNCSASSSYTDSNGDVQGYVVNEISGSWGDAAAIPGLVALNTGNDVQVESISCSSSGNCSVGGTYSLPQLQSQAFVANEVSGTWESAAIVPGSQQLNAGNSAVLRNISCASDGNCSAGGGYTLADGQTSEVFVVDEINGTWRNAQEVPGSQSLNTAGFAIMDALSCSSPGNCSAGGDYNVGNPTQSFLVDEVNGTWGQAIPVPGSSALGVGSGINSLSCSKDNYCLAGGNAGDGTGAVFQPFVVSRDSADSATSIVTATPMAILAATGFNLTLPIVLATSLVGLGGIGVLEAQRRRRKA